MLDDLTDAVKFRNKMLHNKEKFDSGDLTTSRVHSESFDPCESTNKAKSLSA